MLSVPRDKPANKETVAKTIHNNGRKLIEWINEATPLNATQLYQMATSGNHVTATILWCS